MISKNPKPLHILSVNILLPTLLALNVFNKPVSAQLSSPSLEQRPANSVATGSRGVLKLVTTTANQSLLMTQLNEMATEPVVDFHFTPRADGQPDSDEAGGSH